LVTTYSSNITGAVATLLACLLWGLTALGAEVGWCMVGRQPVSTLSWILVPYWTVAWLLVPLYLKRIRWSFILGIVFIVIAMVGITAMPGALPWYTFATPLYGFSFVAFYLVALALIYFSYASYRELRKA